MFLLRIQSFLLWIQSYYSGSKVITPGPKFLLWIQSYYFWNKGPIYSDTGVGTRDIQFTIQHGGGGGLKTKTPPQNHS